MRAANDPATEEVVATYRARRSVLLTLASEDERGRRPELIDREPEGIGSYR